jgi:hypothetical protein
MVIRESEGAKLRREIGRRESSHRPLHRELRTRCQAYASRRASEGASQTLIAEELGLSAMSIQRWLRAKALPSVTAMFPVHVRAPAPLQSTSRAVVTTPRGLRIEGLDLDAICTLIARLG